MLLNKIIRLGSLLGKPLSIFPLIGESISKILGKKKLPKILLIPICVYYSTLSVVEGLAYLDFAR